MKRLATAIAAIALIGTPAFAADMARKMPVKAPPPAPAPVYSWTGWYIGGNVGGGWGDRDVTFTPNDPAAAVFSELFGQPSPSSFKLSGVGGGLQLGYSLASDPSLFPQKLSGHAPSMTCGQ